MRHIFLVAAFVTLFFGALYTPPVYAQVESIISSDVSVCDFKTGEIKAECVPKFLAHIIRFIFGITGSIALIMIMISGYQWALGTLIGNDSGGKETLRNAIIGFIVSALAFFIISFILGTISGDATIPSVSLPGAAGGGGGSGGGNSGGGP